MYESVGDSDEFYYAVAYFVGGSVVVADGDTSGDTFISMAITRAHSRHILFDLGTLIVRTLLRLVIIWRLWNPPTQTAGHCEGAHHRLS